MDNKKYVIKAPTSGRCIELNKINDGTFSNKLLGEGIAIISELTGDIYAPISGIITKILATKNAFIIENEDGVNVLVYFAISSYKLKGKGFDVLLQEGDSVKAGDLVIKYDKEYIKEKDISLVTPVVVLDFDLEEYKILDMAIEKDVNKITDIIIEIEK